MCNTNLRFTYVLAYLLTYLTTCTYLLTYLQGGDNNVVGDDNDHDVIELVNQQ